MRVTVKNIAAFGSLRSMLGEVNPQILAQSVNRVMGPERTKIRRSLTKTTGIAYQRINAVVKTEMATPAKLSYKIEATDEFLPLSFFKARIVRAGVSAAPWATRRTFPSAFIRHGTPFVRVGQSRYPIKRLWGPSAGRELGREGGEPLTMWRVDTGAAGARIIAEVLRRMRVGK